MKKAEIKIQEQRLKNLKNSFNLKDKNEIINFLIWFFCEETEGKSFYETYPLKEKWIKSREQEVLK